MSSADILSYNLFFSWILSFVSYLPIISFLAPIIGGGEIGVIMTSFLFSKTPYLFFIIILFSFLGIISIDSFWFFVARSKLFNKFKEIKKISPNYKKLEENIESISRGKDSLVIFISKLIIGTRILLILYISGRKISYSKYLLYDTIPTLVWSICLTTIGVLLSLGFDSAITLFKNIQLAITLIILLVFGLYLIQKWLMKRLMKKRNQ